MTVATQTAETLRLCGDATDSDAVFGDPLMLAGEFGREWAYALVRSGVKPEAAVRQVAARTWRRTGPGFESPLWIHAAKATLDRHAATRRYDVRPDVATADRDDRVLAVVVQCLRRAMEGPPVRDQEGDFRALATADLLATADRHEFSRTHQALNPERVWLAEWVKSRPFDCTRSVDLGRVAAISALVNPELLNDPTAPHERLLRRFVGATLSKVGRSSSGVGALRNVPPRMVTVLVESLLGETDRRPAEHVRLVRYLLEQLRLASTTKEWRRLPLEARHEWDSLLRRYRSHLAPDLDTRTVRSIQRNVRQLEDHLARQPRVHDEDYTALMEAAASLRLQLDRIGRGRRVRPIGDASSAPGYRLTARH